MACGDCPEVCFVGASGRKDLCMVPCHSCHIYGIWTSRSRKVWWMLKSHQGRQVHREGRFLLCNTPVLLKFIGNFTGYKILLVTSFHYTNALFYVFEVGKAKSSTQSVLMILTLNGLFQNNFSSFLLYP